ncbi:MAG: HDIG domain-containing protein [Gemmatimonadota bacterium]|nr:HDIG domain-containing protein [Gemmatimonadota bacterium]
MNDRWVRRMERVAGEIGDAIQRWRPSGDPTAPIDLAWRLGLLGALATLALVLFPPRGGYDVPRVRAGTVASEDVIAPIDFEVPRSEEELASRREQAALTVPPVFAEVPAAADSAIAAVDAYLERATEVDERDTVTPAALESLNRVDGRSLGLRPAELRDLLRAGVRDSLRAFAREALPELYRRRWLIPADDREGLSSAQIALRRPDAQEELVARSELVGLAPGAEIPGLGRRARDLGPDLEPLALQLIPGLIPPNLRPRPAVTAIRRQQAREAVEPIEEEVLQGELIVGAHTRVTPGQEAKVRALAAELERSRGGVTPEDVQVAMGKLGLNAALLLLFGFYLFLYCRDVFDDLRALAVIVVVWGLVAGIGGFVDRVEGVPGHAVPIAFASVMVAVLWNTRLSAVTTLFLAVFLASQGELGMPLLWTGLLAGLAGGWSVRRIRRRTHFYESLVFIFVGHATAVGLIALLRLWELTEFGVAVAWGGLSAALAVFLAMGLLPVLEWASGRTTDLTLLELADLNRPLLKRLLLEAPGTYHHAIIVGNLAESAAEGIGANSLLARVGAYYHDIGKIERPEYFAENQGKGGNPHDALSARASARIVIRHVTDGVALAKGAGLPEVVVDFIREHHGTTRLTYFWERTEEESPLSTPTESEFRYPGPKPRSKETAVVMLADSVEAASRTVRDPSPERFREVVQRIVEMKLEERQLERTGLAFADLSTVEEKFVSVLTGIHHHRIEYPGVPLHAPEEEAKHERADTVPRVGPATG